MSSRPGERLVLIVDDSTSAMELAMLFRDAKLASIHARSAAEAMYALEHGEFDAIVASVELPDLLGSEFISRATSKWPDIPLLALLGGENATTQETVTRAGARECIAKPFEAAEVLYLVRRAIASTEFAKETPPVQALGSVRELPLKSAKMREVVEIAQRAAHGNSTVLIRGESGTGKELLARYVHELSPRRDQRFVKVHCAALPEPILESELFGYERGAFTGAFARKPGRVELAEGGTLFLDEIGDVSLAVQVKLLQVLQDREYERLGGTRTLKANVRFLAATHRDLEKMVKRGEFREDLYYRLNVVPVVIPPLRDRREDIEPLARHFCILAGAANNRSVTLEPDALKLIREARWPGNVRQLQNFVERLVVLSEADNIDAAHVQHELDREMGSGISGESNTELSGVELSTAVRQTERRVLEKALRKANGNRLLAARILGVSRRTLFYKLREYGLS